MNMNISLSDRIYHLESGLKAARAERKKAEEAARKEAAALAMTNADLHGWPPLHGSERQIAWALVLRQEFYDTCLQCNPTNDDMEILTAIIQHTTIASDWIDARERWPEFLLAKAKPSEPAQVMQTFPLDEMETDIETIVEPENRTHAGVATISIIGDMITIAYHRDDDFCEIVKKFNFRWDPRKRVWHREMNLRSGRAEDRAAEIGNALLISGFAIRAENEFVRKTAVSADFEPECKRWVMLCTSGKFAGKLLIYFARGDEDAYKAAKLIPGSRWSAPNVVIPISEWASVMDMAKIKQFNISDAAKKAIEDYRASITIAMPSQAPNPAADGSPANILNSSREILEDLKDE